MENIEMCVLNISIMQHDVMESEIAEDLCKVSEIIHEWKKQHLPNRKGIIYII